MHSLSVLPCSQSITVCYPIGFLSDSSLSFLKAQHMFLSIIMDNGLSWVDYIPLMGSPPMRYATNPL